MKVSITDYSFPDLSVEESILQPSGHVIQAWKEKKSASELLALVADAARLDQKLHRADLVITGEGRLDRSTLMGKGVGELAKRCRKLGVDCIALGGCIADREMLAGKFSFVGALTDFTSATQAQAKAKLWLQRLAMEAARQIKQA